MAWSRGDSGLVGVGPTPSLTGVGGIGWCDVDPGQMYSWCGDFDDHGCGVQAKRGRTQLGDVAALVALVLELVPDLVRAPGAFVTLCGGSRRGI